jgi:MFS family permease
MAPHLLARVPEPLRSRGFRRFWSAQTISYLGDQVTLLALPLAAVLALHATTAQVGYLAMVATLPPLVIGMHAGAWVDRFRRRRLILVSADLTRAVLLTSIPVAYLLDRLSMIQLYGVAALVGVATVLFNVSAASVIPALIPREQRVTGNSLLRGSFSFSWVAGPGAGGLLVGVITAPLALVVDAISFLISATLIRTVRIPEIPLEKRAPEGVGAGLHFIARHRVLRPYVVGGAVLNLGYTIYFTLLAVFAVRELGLTPAQLGLAFSAGALGALIGSVLTGRITRRLGVGPALILGAWIYAGALLAIPFAPRTHPWAGCATIAVAEFVSGFGLMLTDINGLSLMQTITPERMLGRVSGAIMASTYGARSFAALAAGILGSWLGLAPTIGLAAALGLACIPLLILSPIRGMQQLPEQAISADDPPEPEPPHLVTNSAGPSQ